MRQEINNFCPRWVLEETRCHPPGTEPRDIEAAIRARAEAFAVESWHTTCTSLRWNAIGKRKGAWALQNDAPEATRGFLLNHLIHELLPPKGDGLRWANSDPVTGQAAWFDLRVKITRTEVGDGCSEPQFEPLKPVPGIVSKPKDLRFGEEFLPEGSWRRKKS